MSHNGMASIKNELAVRPPSSMAYKWVYCYK